MATRTTVTISARFDTVRDARLIAWLNAQGDKSAAIRDAVRVAMMGGQVTSADVLRAVERIEGRLSSGAVVVGAVGDLPQADDGGGEFDAALDAIGT